MLPQCKDTIFVKCRREAGMRKGATSLSLRLLHLNMLIVLMSNAECKKKMTLQCVVESNLAYQKSIRFPWLALKVN